jgi:hypothetical protein
MQVTATLLEELAEAVLAATKVISSADPGMVLTPGLGSLQATSAPGLGSNLPHWRRDRTLSPLKVHMGLALAGLANQ